MPGRNGIQFENSPVGHRYLHVFSPIRDHLPSLGVYSAASRLPAIEAAGLVWIGEEDEASPVLLTQYAQHYVDDVWEADELAEYDRDFQTDAPVPLAIRSTFPDYSLWIKPILVSMGNEGGGPFTVALWVASAFPVVSSPERDWIYTDGITPGEAARGLWHALRIQEGLVEPRLYPNVDKWKRES